MLKNTKFRSVTAGIDAIWIWGTALIWTVTLIFGLIDGWGIAISFLLALAAIPLATTSIAVYRNRRELTRAITRLLSTASEPFQSVPGDPNLFEYDAALEAKDVNAYYDLMNFALTRIFPACESQIALQETVIRRLSLTEEISELAINGLYHLDHSGSKRFWTHYHNIVHGIDSSEPTIKFDALVNSIKGLESNAYREFCQKGHERVEIGDIKIDDDAELYKLQDKWIENHNDLVNKYDAIKSDIRFGDKLFRPRKPSRWGRIIELHKSEG